MGTFGKILAFPDSTLLQRHHFRQGAGVLGTVVPVPCADRVWLGIQVLWTLGPGCCHKAFICLWNVGCVPWVWLGKHG